MVETLVACEQANSLLLWTTMLNAAGDADAKKSISALKYHLGTAGEKVAQEAIQIHGGMGVTWELDISHYFKRFTAIEVLFGDADFHINRYIGLS
jgi:alkylation response protein AidB-like acyl-CoA dehydrogenase